MDIARITKPDTKEALERIRRAEPLEGNPLLDMEVLRLRLAATGTTVTDESLEWALSGLLSELVEGALRSRRGGGDAADRATLLDRAPSAAHRAADPETWHLEADLTSADPDTGAWSCLYARYLAVHALQVQEIAALARPGSPHGRKLVSRRIDLGISLLAGALREEEQRAHDSPRTWADSDRAAMRKHNLPARHSSFVGRQSELAEVTNLLSSATLVTLVGPGGVGKTRLAIQVATVALDNYPDGVWMVELAPVTDPALVPRAVAAAVNVSERRRESVTDALRRELARRRYLIVLDNCEHVRDVCAGLAESLMDSCPAVRILATSREALGVEGEYVWAVPPLDVPKATDDLQTELLQQYPAVQLFIDRAKAVTRHLNLDGADVTDIAELCRRLDGLPLAIELAAARTAMMPIQEISGRLEDRFRLLTDGRRKAGDRQQTLRGAIDWSHDLLDESERTMFRSLSVFRGSWSVEAAESVCRTEGVDVLEQIGALVRKSLVTPVGNGHGARFRMLESITQYAADRLAAAGEVEAACLRHQAYYLQLAEAADAGLDGQAQAEWLARLAVESDNLAAALDAGRLSDGAAQSTLRLAGTLARFWQLRGRLSEGRQWLAVTLALPANQLRTPERAYALNGAGELAYLQGDYDDARRLHEESAAIQQESQSPTGVAAAMRSLGKIADAMGDYDAARSHYERALATYESVGDTWGKAATLNNLGLVTLRQGEPALARSRFEESLAAFRKHGDTWAIGVTLSNLADVAMTQGDLTAARDLFDQSLAIARDLGDRDGEAYALTSLGNVACRTGDVEASRRYLAGGLDALRETEAKSGIAEWLEAAARLAAATGDAPKAVTLLGVAEALREEIDAPLPEKDAPAHEALVSSLAGQLPRLEFDRAWQAGRIMTWGRAAGITGLQGRVIYLEDPNTPTTDEWPEF